MNNEKRALLLLGVFVVLAIAPVILVHLVLLPQATVLPMWVFLVPFISALPLAWLISFALDPKIGLGEMGQMLVLVIMEIVAFIIVVITARVCGMALPF